jgi:uncharacterized membrane protein YcgQ (UPF0703/DUF1980 family)
MQTSMKSAGITMAAKIPKALIGIIGLKTFARKATHVVLDVTNMALADRRIAYAILYFFVSNSGSSPSVTLNSGIVSLCLQASIRTKKSSAAIPRTIKMTRLFKLL